MTLEFVGGVGVVEGEDAVEAQEVAPQVHEAALEGVAEAEQVADEVADEPDEDAESDEDTAGDDAEPVGGVGVVEGEDAVEAQEVAPQVHEAALEGLAEAEQVADEVADEPGRGR